MRRRWWIAVLITAANAISYLDRLTLSVAVDAIRHDIAITNTQFSNLNVAFLLAYAAMYLGGGRLIDVLGTRRGVFAIMVFWSLATASHGLATGFLMLASSRFLLGLGEGGTLFDLMMAETKPEYVSYQMDVFWIVHAGQDPIALFEKYGNRFQLTHLKGMKDTTPTGLSTGHSDVANDVPVGTGKIDFPPIFRAAEKAGVKWHFIEDESPTSEEQIPQSLRYLEQVTW
jgi:hypothetical protein